MQGVDVVVGDGVVVGADVVVDVVVGDKHGTVVGDGVLSSNTVPVHVHALASSGA